MERTGTSRSCPSGLTDGNLGAHLRRLEEAGYVTIVKTFVRHSHAPYLHRRRLSCVGVALVAVSGPDSGARRHHDSQPRASSNHIFLGLGPGAMERVIGYPSLHRI
jgi:hypothetical protein